MDIEITTLPNPRYGGEEAHHRSNLILYLVLVEVATSSASSLGLQSEDAIKSVVFSHLLRSESGFSVRLERRGLS